MKMFKKLMLCVFAALMLFGCSTPGDATDDTVIVNFDTNGECSIDSIRILRNEKYWFRNYYPQKKILAYKEGVASANNIVDLPETEAKMIEGWYKDSALTQKITDKTPIKTDGDITVYAKFVDACKITIKVGCAEGSTKVEKDANCFIFISQGYSGIINENNYFERLVNPVEEGKIVEDFYYDLAFTQPIPANNELQISEDITIYAKVNDAVIMNFNANGGTEIEPIKVVKGGKYRIYYDYISKYITIDKEGKNLSYEHFSSPENGTKLIEGWYEDSALTQKITRSNPITTDSDVTVYAKWVDACKVTVKFGDEEIKFDVPKGEKLFFRAIDRTLEVYRPTDIEYLTEKINLKNDRYTGTTEDERIYTDTTYENSVSYPNEAIIINGDTTFYAKMK